MVTYSDFNYYLPCATCGSVSRVVESDECTHCHQVMKSNRLGLDPTIDRIAIYLIEQRPITFGAFSFEEYIYVFIRVFPAVVFTGLMAYAASFISVDAVGVALIISALITIPLIFKGQFNWRSGIFEISRETFTYDTLTVDRQFLKAVHFNEGSYLEKLDYYKPSVGFIFVDSKMNLQIVFESAGKARQFHRVLSDFLG